METLKRNIDVVEKVIIENYNRYYRLAMSYVHSEQDAYDLVQNTACKAIAKCDSLNKQEYASTWIYKILLNEIYDFLGSTRDIYTEDLSEIVDQGQGNEDRYNKYIDLKKAINKLSVDEGIIIKLRFFEDMSLNQIAEILELPLSTVKSRLYRCLQKLRINLEI